MVTPSVPSRTTSCVHSDPNVQHRGNRRENPGFDSTSWRYRALAEHVEDAVVAANKAALRVEIKGDEEGEAKVVVLCKPGLDIGQVK